MSAALPLPDLPVQTPAPSAVRSSRENYVLYGVTSLLMFLVLGFGGRGPWPVYIFQAGSAALLLAWFLEQSSSALTIRWHPLFAPMIAFAGLLGIQLLPGLSAYWYATYSQALQFVSYGIVCFLVVQSLNHSRQVRKLATALSIFGAAVALFAVLQNLSSPNRLYWLLKPRAGGWIYGPYVNHNHYAGLMEMLVPIPLVFAFTHFSHRRKRWVAASIAAFMAATIFLSGSRGGMIAFAAELVLFLYLLLREKQKRSAGFLLVAFFCVVVAVVSWTGGREVKARIATMGSDRHSDLSSDVRLQIDRDVLLMALKHPVLGWGQGTFAEVYPRFRSFYTDLRVNAAHNDYLQLLSETGIAGFAIMVWFLVTAIRAGIAKSQTWTSNLNGAVSVAAIVGISGILVHSLVDFNLQMPANAALFYCLCVVAGLEPRFTSHHRSHRIRRSEFVNDPGQPVNA